MVVGLSVFKHKKREYSGAIMLTNRTSANGVGAGTGKLGYTYNYNISGSASKYVVTVINNYAG